jgi:3-oxoacyl-[acyl-carrier-protein] synthase III
MATTLDPPSVAMPRWHIHPSARKLADAASREAIDRAGLNPGEVDLLLNTGIYHDRNLGEPALAALIQEDVGMNPEDPSARRAGAGAHGTFSFDIANGGCGVLTALEIADGFLQSGTIRHALVVASDSDPGHRMAPDFPFSARGAAIACHWEEGAGGLLGFRWERSSDPSETFRSHVGFEEGRNRLRVEQNSEFGALAAALAAKAVASLLADHGLEPIDVDLVVANPLTAAFLKGLSNHSGLDLNKVIQVDGADQVHTAAPIVALAAAEQRGILHKAHNVLIVSAGAGIVAGSALLARQERETR